MNRRPRIVYTEEQKALMWDRWQKGDSLHDIARLFDRHHTSVRGVLWGRKGRVVGDAQKMVSFHRKLFSSSLIHL